MAELTIAGRRIADDEPCFVIAELGHNHGGSITTAVSMIHAASDAGVDAVKLQKRDNLNLYTLGLLNQPYENENSFGSCYGEHRMALEFDAQDYSICRAEAENCDVALFATAFDEHSADFLANLGVPAFKIHSGGLKDTPLLKHVAGYGKPMIVSTGGGGEEDIDRAVNAVYPLNSQVAILHATASYPCQPDELNLRCILTLRKRYPELVIGWSGHDTGIAMALVAYAFGARIIEKHFTLDRASKGTDHAFSLEPQGMATMCENLLKAHVALGSGLKVPYPSEKAPIYKMERSIVAARDLRKGTIIRREDVKLKIPASGLPPYLVESIVGFPLSKDVKEDESVTHKHIQGEKIA